MRQNKLFLFLLSVLFSVGAMAQTATSLPYSTGFEDATDNASWQFANATVNQWCIGAAANHGGSNALYISNDGGTTYTYSATYPNAYQTSFAYRAFHFEKGDYTISFDWQCEGEPGYSSSSAPYDFMQVVLTPASITIEGASAESGKLGSIASFGKNTKNTEIEKAGYIRATCANPYSASYPYCFLKQSTWSSGEIFNISIDNAGDYYLVFSWHNDGGVHIPPAAVDNISISKKACGDIKAISTAAITSNSATLSWNAIEGAVGYDYFVGATLNETMAQRITAATITLTGLSANSDYTAYVRSVCAEGNGVWKNVAFHTDCAEQSIPYAEDFEGTMPAGNDVMPYCWNSVQYGGYPYVKTDDGGWSTSAHGGKGYLNFFGSNSEQIAILPTLAVNANQLQVSFYYRNGSKDYTNYGTTYKYPKFVVGVMSDPADAKTFVTVDTLPQETSYTLAKIYLNNVPATHNYIAIKFVGTTYSSSNGYVDDISVDYLPTCLPAKDIHVEATTQTSATIAWTAGGDETQWSVKYVQPGETDTVTTQVNGTPSLTINGLKHSTSYLYKVSVQSDCGNGDKAEVATTTLSFATECALLTAVSDSILLDFEQYSDKQNFADVPCWNTFAGKNSPDNTWAVQSGSAYKGAMAAYLNNLSDNAKSAVLVTPELEIPEKSELSLYVRSGYSSSSTADDSLIVYINANPTLEGATRLGKITELTSDYQFFRFSLETFRGNYYVLIESYSYGSVLVDNILISPEPACLPPTKLLLGDVAARQATFSWTPGKNETQWQIVVANNSQSVYREEIVDEPSYALDDLEPATTDTFSITINSLCDNVPSVEALRGTLIFTTICEPADHTAAAPGDTLLFTSFEADDENEAFSPDEAAYWDADKHICWTNERVGGSSGYIWQVQQSSYRAHSGNQYLTIPNSSNDRPKVLFALPAMTFSAGQEIGLSFWVEGNSSDSIIVYINNQASLEGATRVGCTGKLKSDYVHYEFDPIQTLEGVNYILLYIEHQISGDTYLDDIVVRMLPNCRKVKSAEITDIATTSAKLAWKKAYEENTWNVVVKNGKDTLLNTQATTPSVLLENLTPATKYTLDVTIAAVCDGAEAAEKYSGQLSFTTECEVITAFPWREGFESMPTGSSTSDGPLCWNILDANQGGNASVFVASSYTPSSYGYNPPKAYHSGSHGMVMALTSGRDAAAYALLPDMENAAGKQLVFWYKLYETSKKLEVGYLTDPADKSTWKTIASYTPKSSNIWEEIKVTLAVPEDVVNPHFGFRFAASYSSTAAYIDDIKVREVPVCDMATDLHVIDSLSTATTATVAWAGLADAGYTVIFRGNDTITKQVTDTFCVLDGLTASRIYKYEVSVVARCAAGEAVDTLTVNLQWLTDCAGAVTTFPYNVGFEEEEGYKASTSADEIVMPNCVVSEKLGEGNYRLVPYSSAVSNIHTGKQCLYILGNNNSGYTPKNISSFAFPEIVIPEGNQYEFAIWTKAMGSTIGTSTYNDSVEVFYNTEKQSLDGAVKIGSFKPTYNYTQHCITIPKTGKQYIIIKVWARNMWFFDDASFRKIPTCFPVENVRVSATGLDTARIVWDTKNDGASYRVTIKQGENVLYNGLVNDTVLVLRNLNPSSMYNNLQTTIVTVCTDGEESADIYTGTISFATECGVVTEFPWVEDFEGYESNNTKDGLEFVHPCWLNEHIEGPGNKLFAISHKLGATHNLVAPDNNATTYTRLTLPTMDIPEAGGYDFSMDIYRESSGKETEGVFVIVGTDTLGFVARKYSVAGLNIPAEDSYNKWFHYTFTLPKAGVQNIVILGRAEYGYAIYMDNFTVKANGKTPTALPTTGAATDLAIKFISNGQVYILRNGVIYNALGQRVEMLK